MKLRSKVFALVGAGALVLSVAGAAFASTQINWTGNGTTEVDGHLVLNTEDCTADNDPLGEGVPYLYWVLSPADGITSAELWVNGTDMGAMTQFQDNGNQAFKLTTDFFDLDTLSAYAVVDGSDLSNALKLKISHGCAGTTTTTSSESSSSTTEFTNSVSDTTSASLPNTATLGDDSPAGMSSTSWLLIAALGVIGASIVVLMPSRAKTRR